MREAIWNECIALWRAGDTQALRRQEPNGLHRLRHLVPDMAPDQIELARELAGLALDHRSTDLADSVPLKVYARYQEARRSPAALSMLVREARSGVKKAWLAWQACAMFITPEARSGFVWKDGQWHKVVEPIPEQIQALMEDHFSGRIERPAPRKTGTPPEKTDMRDDVIRFAVWMALEADIKATARAGKPCACSIVAEMLPGISAGTVADIWKRREVAPNKAW